MLGDAQREMEAMPADDLAGSAVPLERDAFLRTMLRELSGALQEIVGMEEASGFISVVGAHVGKQIDQTYKGVLNVERLRRDQVAAVLVDLKARIQGDFRVVEEDEGRIVFSNTRCPFGRAVEGRPSLCMMTSNVFGFIAAENLGYANVDIEESIAAGAPGCRVVVNFGPGSAPETAREYFSTADVDHA